VPVTILVADDSATMRSVLEMTFAGEDARVVAVDTGDEAIAKAREIKPDVVFADLSLQGADGYEIARSIKSQPALASTAVIVMASQFTPYDEQKGKACGVDDHIIKPFDTQAVINRVTQVLTRPRAAAAGGAQVGPPPPPPVARPAPPPPPSAAAKSPLKSTIAFGAAPVQPRQIAVGAPAASAARPAAAVASPSAAAAVASPARSAPSSHGGTDAVSGIVTQPSSAAASATSGNGEMAQRLAGLGLTAEQVEGVLKLSREVIERVVWEVVPDLAEVIIREEIKRLTE